MSRHQPVSALERSLFHRKGSAGALMDVGTLSVSPDLAAARAFSDALQRQVGSPGAQPVPRPLDAFSVESAKISGFVIPRGAYFTASMLRGGDSGVPFPNPTGGFVMASLPVIGTSRRLPTGQFVAPTRESLSRSSEQEGLVSVFQNPLDNDMGVYVLTRSTEPEVYILSPYQVLMNLSGSGIG